jgi:hypothetical protein
MGIRRLGYAACYGLVIFVVTATPAFAYLDPGSGSAILQGILAAVVAVGITAKLYWHKILVFLKIRKKTEFLEKKSESGINSAGDESN